MDLSAVRAAMERAGAIWSEVLAEDPDPDTLLKEIDDEEGFEQDSATGVVLAQAIHHGTDHRSQICTALSALGIEPPEIDVWAYGLATGRVVPSPNRHLTGRVAAGLLRPARPGCREVR